MEDPREELLTNLNISKCRIISSASSIVLLCGGKVKLKERPNDDDPPIKSLRHAISLKHPEFEIFRPEEITEWQEDAVFKNLVDFETELAAICTLVVLILESSGSIAELGAFSQLVELREKLLVIKSADYSEGENAKSFISLGILRHLKEQNQESVKIFPWDIRHPARIEDEVVEDVIEGIKTSLNSLNGEHTLNLNKDSHSTTVISELIRIFIALKKVEITTYLNNLGFSLSKHEITRKLFLLERFKLIKAVEYSGAVYYLRTSSSFNKLRLTSNSKVRLEDTRITLDCRSFYETNKDRYRLAAIKRFQTVVRK